MKINRADLVEALDTVRPAVATQEIIPVLSDFLVEDGEITATDLDVGMVTPFAAFKDVAFRIPADRFYKLVSSLPQEKIEIDVQEECLEITAKGHRSKLGIASAPDDFPRIRRQFRKWLKPPDNLIRGLRVCLKTTDEARGGAFGSVMWCERGLVSTDAHLISWCPGMDPWHCPHEAVLLSAKFAREAVRLGQPDGWVVHEGAVCFKYGETQLLGQLIVAMFPPSWETFFPEKTPRNMVELGSDVRESLKRIGKFTKKESYTPDALLTQLTLEGGKLGLSYDDPEGSIEEQVEVSGGQKCKVHVDSAQLADVLGVCNKGVYLEIDDRHVLYLQGEGGWPRVVMSVSVEGIEDED